MSATTHPPNFTTAEIGRPQRKDIPKKPLRSSFLFDLISPELGVTEIAPKMLAVADPMAPNMRQALGSLAPSQRRVTTPVRKNRCQAPKIPGTLPAEGDHTGRSAFHEIGHYAALPKTVEIRPGPMSEYCLYFSILGRTLPDVTLTSRNKGRVV